MFNKMSRWFGKNRPTQARKRPQRRPEWLALEQPETLKFLAIFTPNNLPFVATVRL
jgi:hypothetical protein